MQTQSHFLMTAVANRFLKRNADEKSKAQVNSRALLLGSFAPDIPLFILSFIFIARNVWFAETPQPNVFGEAYDTLYFTNPLWIITHNIFHAPPMIIVYLLIGYFVGIRGGKKWAYALFWFAVGCAGHSAIDILTHHNDGPLLLFPFNWELRFSSPVSYWDDDYYANILAPLEMLLNIGIIGYFLRDWLKKRSEKRQINSAKS